MAPPAFLFLFFPIAFELIELIIVETVVGMGYTRHMLFNNLGKYGVIFFEVNVEESVSLL